MREISFTSDLNITYILAVDEECPGGPIIDVYHEGTAIAHYSCSTNILAQFALREIDKQSTIVIAKILPTPRPAPIICLTCHYYETFASTPKTGDCVFYPEWTIQTPDHYCAQHKFAKPTGANNDRTKT